MDKATIQQIVSATIGEAMSGNPIAIWLTVVVTLGGAAYLFDRIWWHARNYRGNDPTSKLADEIGDSQRKLRESQAKILDLVSDHARADGTDHRMIAQSLDQVAEATRELAREIRESAKEGSRERAEIRREAGEQIGGIRVELAKLSKGGAL